MEKITSAMWLQIACSLSLGFVLTWGLIGAILRRAQNQGTRGRGQDFHHTGQQVPRLGGVGIVAAFIAVALVIASTTALPPNGSTLLIATVLSSTAMFALGLCDDIRPLGAKFKLLAQIAIASAAYASNIRIEFVKSPFDDSDIPLGGLAYFATVIWLVSLPNLINLIDGIDGLAGGICLMLMFLMTNLGLADNSGFSMLLATGMAGALLAFLKFNYPPAKIYLGDGGAYFVGFLIGVLSIINSNKGTVAAALIAPAFALALPIVDVTLAILRRGLRGLPLFRPDRRHIHHRLITLGISHEQTLLNLYTVSLLCLILAFGLFTIQGRMLPLYTGLLFLLLLIAGHLSGFTKNWSNLRSQLGKSLSLRKHTRYALLLDRWFMMEAQRLNSPDEIWEEYRFIVKKLGFSKVTLSLSNGITRSWQADGFEDKGSESFHTVHAVSTDTTIEFIADQTAMSETVFSLLGDLAAETWYKAIRHLSKTQRPLPPPDNTAALAKHGAERKKTSQFSSRDAEVVQAKL